MSRELIFSASRKDFRIDTFRCGGPGGQNVNKVETGVRITYLPWGLSSECREERSQHANRVKAFRNLCQKITQRLRQQLADIAPERNTTTIRTYHEPDDRVKDHLSGKQFSYRQVVGKGDISGPLTARLRAIEEQRLGVN